MIMRAEGRPSGSTVAALMAVELRTTADASAIHVCTRGRGSSGSGSGSGGVSPGSVESLLLSQTDIRIGASSRGRSRHGRPADGEVGRRVPRGPRQLVTVQGAQELVVHVPSIAARLDVP